MKKNLLTIVVLIFVFVLVACDNSDDLNAFEISEYNDTFFVEDLTGTWLRIFNDRLDDDDHGGYSVLILNDDGSGLDGFTGMDFGITQINWEIKNGNHLYLTDTLGSIRRLITFNDGILMLTTLDYPKWYTTYVLVDYIEITDNMVQH